MDDDRYGTPGDHDPDVDSDRKEDVDSEARSNHRHDEHERWLRRELATWIDEEIITETQAAAIRTRYGFDRSVGNDDVDTDRGVKRSRIVTIVAAMGALLVGMGVLVFLAANWTAIPRPVRLGIVLGTTGAFLASGWELRTRRDRPRVGHALLVVGAVAIGIACFLVDDLYGLPGGEEWLFLVWFALTLPLGHALRSIPVALVGLGAAGGALISALTGIVVLPVGLFALSLYGVSIAVEEWGDADLVPAYRLAGVVGTLLAALGILASDAEFGRLAPDADVPLVALFVGAAVTVVGASIAARSGRTTVATAAWSAIGLVTVGGAAIVGLIAPEFLPELGRVVLWHGLVVGLLLATVAVGYVEDSALLVNVALASFLFQVLIVLVSTVLEALPGSVALIVGGLTLLAVALGLERGRRELFDRMQNEKP